VVTQSGTENEFASLCALDGNNVRFFFKLPAKFKIPTPLGTYNPDWAVVLEGDTRVYFVAETKSSTVEAERRLAENLQIKCGIAHFKLSPDVVFQPVTTPGQLKAPA
jgi:type III restriction enzyme